MNTISIHEALAKMAEAEDKPFRIEFVRATGANAGSIKSVVCYYGAPNPKPRNGQANVATTARKQRKTHLDSGTVPLTEVGNRRLLTPMISHIITFNGKQVIH